jgi:hypothetical protein
MTFDAFRADKQRICKHAEVDFRNGTTWCASCGVRIDYGNWLKGRGADCEQDILREAFAKDSPGDTRLLTFLDRESAETSCSTLRVMIAGARQYAELNRPFTFDYTPNAIRRSGDSGKWDVRIHVPWGGR